MLSSETSVDDMLVTDLGGGQLSLKAKGQFYSSSLGVIVGSAIISPRTFDGTNVEIVASAKDLLSAGDLQIVDPDGQTQPFGLEANPLRACGIKDAYMFAVPRPDGNSRVQLHIDLGEDYDPVLDRDRLPRPLVLVGDTVYGLKETPFLGQAAGGYCTSFGDNGTVFTTCGYEFLAPTVSLRNAQNFLVRDLTWSSSIPLKEISATPGFRRSDTISFTPSFASLAAVASYSSTGLAGAALTALQTQCGDITPSAAGASGGADTRKSSFYTISGFDLDRLNLSCNINTNLVPELQPCLRVLAGHEDVSSSAKFTVQSPNVATMCFNPQPHGAAKALRLQVYWNVPGVNLATTTVEWALPLPKQDTTANSVVANPPFLRVGDSVKVSFSGGGLCQNNEAGYQVAFEGVSLAAPNTTTIPCSRTDPANPTLDVSIPTMVTRLFGHKDLTVTLAPGAAAPSGGKMPKLGIDVLKQ